MGNRRCRPSASSPSTSSASTTTTHRDSIQSPPVFFFPVPDSAVLGQNILQLAVAQPQQQTTADESTDLVEYVKVGGNGSDFFNVRWEIRHRRLHRALMKRLIYGLWSDVLRRQFETEWTCMRFCWRNRAEANRGNVSYSAILRGNCSIGGDDELHLQGRVDRSVPISNWFKSKADFKWKVRPVTIVDTPGYGDTNGLDRDQEITEMVRQFFKDKGGIQELHVIEFVAQAYLPRLTLTQIYIYSIFTTINFKRADSSISVVTSEQFYL